MLRLLLVLIACPKIAIAGKLNREGWELEEELEQEFGIRVIGNKEREHEAEVLANYAKEVKEKEGGNAKVKLGPYSNLDEHEMEEFMGAIIPDNMDGLESRGYFTGAIIPKNMDRDANNLAKLQQLFSACNANRRSLPLSYDARKHGLVTPVKQQGCYDCYIFAGTAMHETAYLKAGAANPEDLNLSEQFLADCNRALENTNNGCEGGWSVFDTDMVIKLGGTTPAELDHTYMSTRCPYKGSPYDCPDAKTMCEAILDRKDQWHSFGAKLVDYAYIGKYSSGHDVTELWGQAYAEDLLKYIIYTYGSAAVYVTAGKWQNYPGGVMDEEFCFGPEATDKDHGAHLVQAIGWGYDENSNELYFIIKNSWAETWGDMGYGKIKSGTCGILQEFAWATAELTDSAKAHPDHYCNLSDFDGGVIDGVQTLEYLDQAGIFRQTRVYCHDNLCHCTQLNGWSGTLHLHFKVETCCQQICGNLNECVLPSNTTATAPTMATEPTTTIVP